MANATLAAAYHVRVKERYSRTYQPLDQINGNVDFLNFVHDVLEECKAEFDNDTAAERISKTQQIAVDGRVITGRILVGDYGQACDVINASDASTVFQKKVSHADALPFYFRIEIPAGADEALFLIEKSRKTSPTTAFRRMLNSRFSGKFPELTLTIDPVLPASVFDAFLAKGQVQKITFIKMGLPTDIANLLEGGHQEAYGKTEFVVSAGRNRLLPIKKSLLSGDNPKKAIQDLYELKDLDYDNIKVDVKLGRNRRSVDLGRKFVSPLYDLTQQVKKDADGISIYESIDEAFETLAAEIKEGAYAMAGTS
jgi:hypothetical protein